MNTALIIVSMLLVLSAFWIAALYAEKKNLLKDDNDNYIPDVVEDAVKDVKDGINEKVDAVKNKVKNVKKAIKE
jgi:hypothetical protein